MNKQVRNNFYSFYYFSCLSVTKLFASKIENIPNKLSKFSRFLQINIDRLVMKEALKK